MPGKMGMAQGWHPETWRTYGGGFTGALTFSGPSSSSVDKLGRIVIADTLRNRVVFISNDGGVLGARVIDGFNLPNGLFVDTDNSVYVADQGNNVFKIISPAGQVSTFGSPGTGVGQFTQPIGITKDSSGTIWTI